MVTAKIETDRLILGLDSLRDAMVGQGMDASHLVEDETRRLARMIVAFIPPIAKGRSAREVGEGAVERDIKNLISEAKPELIDEVGSRYGVSDIRAAYVTEKGGQQLNLQWEHLDPTGSRLEEYHEFYRDKRTGRVPKVKPVAGIWQSRVVSPLGTRADLIKKTQRHVGSWKASWALVGARLGDKYPSWLSRHFGNPFGIAKLDGLQNREAPFVTFGSRSAGNGRMRERIQGAVRARIRSIHRRVKLMLSGYNKDLASGMKAQARAKNWSEPLPNVE